MPKGFTAVRRQSDTAGDTYSLATAIDFTDAKDVTRQEYRDDQDINVLLRRFGVQVPQRDGGQFNTTVDYSVDLQTALDNIAQVKEAHAGLPEAVRNRYPTWESLLTGLEAGEITFRNPEEKTNDAAADRTSDADSRAGQLAGSDRDHSREPDNLVARTKKRQQTEQ